MADTILRVRSQCLEAGIPGVISSDAIRSFIAPAFTYAGSDYFVHRARNGRGWSVFKCQDDGRCEAEYIISQDRHGLACDCPAGRKHLACRHKEMVRMSLEDRDTGACGHQPRRPVDAPKPGVGAVGHAEAKAGLTEALDAAKRLRERFEQMRKR